MPWFKEEDNKHPAVFFPDAHDFWDWRNQHRPLGDWNDPGEIWDEVGNVRQFEGAPLAPLPNAHNGMMVNFGEIPMGVRLGEIGAGIVVGNGGHAHNVEPAINLHQVQDAAGRWNWVPFEPKEREWEDLPILMRIKYLSEQEAAPIEFRQVMDYIDQIEKDHADRWQEGYGIGYEDGENDQRNRDDD